MMAQCQTCASRVETCRARTGAQLSSCWLQALLIVANVDHAAGCLEP